MHHIMSSNHCRIASVAIFTVCIALSGGCSRSSRIARVVEQANRYFDAGELDRAEIEYKNVLQKAPGNATAIAHLGLIYHQQGRDERAAAYLFKARELQPANLDVRVKLGLVFLSAGGLKQARDEALYVLEHRPADEQAQLLLVEASATPKDLEDARQRLLALPGKAPKSASALTALGNIALKQNRPKDAEKAFNQAIAVDPKSPAAYGSLGVLRWAQRDVTSADLAFKQAADLSPARSPKRLHYAQFKLNTGNATAARQILEEMGRKTPDYVPIWVWLADLAIKEKKYNDAETYVGKALGREPQHAEALLLSAKVRLAKGEADKAVAELERLIATYPRSVQVAYELALAYAATGDTTKALARVGQVVSAAPEMTQAVITQGELHLRQRDFTSAIASLKPLTQQHPELVSARVFLAEAYRGQGSLDEAAAVYATLQKQIPSDAKIAFALGSVLLQQNKIAEARAAFAKARTIDPNQFAALEQLIELDLRERQPAVARQRLEPELAKDPKSGPLNFLLARTYLAENDFAHAEASLKKTIELQPNSTAALYLLSQLYVKANQAEKAIASLRDTTAKSPKSFTPHLLLGVLLDEQNDRTGARDAYEKALALDPKSSLVLNNLAYIYTEHIEQLDRALDLAQRARALLPQDARAADTLGWVLAKKKQYAQASTLLQDSAARLPDEPDVQYHLGFAQYMLGNEQAAGAAFERALQLSPAFSRAADARARLAVLQLVPGKAGADERAALEKRIAASPDDPVALFRLAEFARLNGESDKAVAQYNTLLKLNPRHAPALLGLARVHADKRDWSKALEFAKSARTAAPNDSEITHLLGRLAYEAGDHRWAASLLQDLARARADDADVLFDWAEAAYSVGRVSDAETSMRRALELAPASVRGSSARQFLDMLSLCATPTAVGLSNAEQVLKADPRNGPALMATALIAEQKSDLKSARKYYETLLNRFPEFSPAQRNLTILYAAGPADNQTAGSLANKARQAFPNDTALARAAGIIAYRQGDFTKAMTLLQEAVNKNTVDGETLYYLGMAQSRLNKRTESKQTLQRALEQGLKGSLATEARKSLESS